MPDFYITTIEPVRGSPEDTDDFLLPTWKFIPKKAGSPTDLDMFAVILGKRMDRMTRLDMTKLLLSIPVIKQQLRASGYSEYVASHVGRTLLEDRKIVRLRLAGRADV